MGRTGRWEGAGGSASSEDYRLYVIYNVRKLKVGTQIVVRYAYRIRHGCGVIRVSRWGGGVGGGEEPGRHVCGSEDYRL